MTVSPATPTLEEQFSTPGFGIENLPYASFAPAPGAPARLGARLGQHVIDVAGLVSDRASAPLRDAIATPNLDGLLAAGPAVWHELRSLLHDLVGAAREGENEACIHPLADAELFMPFSVADYVDFYSSENHATNVGQIFRPQQAPLLPNWTHLPVGYHGRAGTIVASGTDIVRPKGLRPEPEAAPSFGPSRRLDIEAEVGFVLGGSAPEGEVPLENARDHIFGVVLVNDWSARDIQAYEYVPLGPFLAKSFATSIGHWVVPLAALDSARVQPPERRDALAPYLDDSDVEPWGFDISLEVRLDDETVSRPPFSAMYWTAAQQLAHLTANGASVRAGDFFASGTVSGPTKAERGSFLELSWGGSDPLTLASGTTMTFLEDGHEVEIRGTAPGANGSTIDFGSCVGRIREARGR